MPVGKVYVSNRLFLSFLIKYPKSVFPFLKIHYLYLNYVRKHITIDFIGFRHTIEDCMKKRLSDEKFQAWRTERIKIQSVQTNKNIKYLSLQHGMAIQFIL